MDLIDLQLYADGGILTHRIMDATSTIAAATLAFFANAPEGVVDGAIAKGM